MERARAAVAARPEGVQQDGMVASLPAELNRHVARLRELAGHLFELGWEPAMVDLTRVCAFQPVVCGRSGIRNWNHSVGNACGVSRITWPHVAMTSRRSGS